MMKIIEIPVADILHDAAACSELPNRAVCRRPSLRVSGLCASENMVFVSLEEQAAAATAPHYRFAELAELERDRIVAALNSRYYAGFAALGSFISGNAVWALFAGPAAKQ